MRAEFSCSYIVVVISVISLSTTTIVHSASSSSSSSRNNNSNAITNRRILHQPLFPAPAAEALPPLLNTPDQPFFHELPNTPDVIQPPPPTTSNPPAAAQNSTVSIPQSPLQTKSARRVAVAVSVGIVTLGMLSALAFFLYRHRVRHPPESQKIVNAGGSSSNRFADDESRPPAPSSFLYIGTVQPSRVSASPDVTPELNKSPYRRLESIKASSDRYRPSPELQPLPPLAKPPPSQNLNSQSIMTSSEDENRETTSFQSPQLSFMTSSAIPHSKRTSPKSRLSVSNRAAPPPPPPPPPPQSVQHSHKKPKFSAPPPPNVGLLRSLADPTGAVSVAPVENEMRSETKQPLEIAEKSVGGAEESLENDDDKCGGAKPKLKPLHWDKHRATSDRATVWDQLESSSFQLNEDMMETLFGCNAANAAPKEASTNATRRSGLPPVEQERRVLDPKKSQNIAILLRALNVARDEVVEALWDGNPEGLGAELLETLVKMAPTKEEEIKLLEYKGDITKLGSAERFLKAVLDIPFAFKRVEAMLYRANFDAEVNYLQKSFQTLEKASEELKNSRLFLKLLEAVLRSGNRMNVGTNRGDAKAFKLDTLLKLVDIKGTDGKTTLLHFVVQEIIRSENPGSETKGNFKINDGDFKMQGLKMVAGLSKDLDNVTKAACMDSDVISGYVSKLATGLQKVRLVLQNNKGDADEQFFNSMKLFQKEADDEIRRIKDDENKALFLVKEVTEYFHGDTTREEAHPFRIFMIVRDFLKSLDHVCKEVGNMQDQTLVGSARSFRIAATAPLPVLSKYHSRQLRRDDISDDDSSDDDSFSL